MPVHVPPVGVIPDKLNMPELIHKVTSAPALTEGIVEITTETGTV